MLNEGESFADILDETDIANFAWSVAVLRRKIVPFLAKHAHHHPRMCPYSDPSLLPTAENLANHLMALIDGFNELREMNGEDAVVTFADAEFTDKDGKFHA